MGERTVAFRPYTFECKGCGKKVNTVVRTKHKTMCDDCLADRQRIASRSYWRRKHNVKNPRVVS